MNFTVRAFLAAMPARALKIISSILPNSKLECLGAEQHTSEKNINFGFKIPIHFWFKIGYKNQNLEFECKDQLSIKLGLCHIKTLYEQQPLQF